MDSFEGFITIHVHVTSGLTSSWTPQSCPLFAHWSQKQTLHPCNECHSTVFTSYKYSNTAKPYQDKVMENLQFLWVKWNYLVLIHTPIQTMLSFFVSILKWKA